MKKFTTFFILLLVAMIGGFFASCYATTGTHEGFEWVDLGLTRGDIYGTYDPNASKRVLFAKTNIGANSETDYGYYFRWGELNGWKFTGAKIGSIALTNSNISQMPKVNGGGYASGSKETYSSNTSDEADWKLDGQSVSDFNGQVHISDPINGQVYGDAARYNWGGAWRMMDLTILDKLEGSYDTLSTSWYSWQIGSVTLQRRWVEDYNGSGINGVEIQNSALGTSIFLPAGGFCYNGYRDFGGYFGIYWSSTPYGSNNGFLLNFHSSDFGWGYNSHDGGFSVRPVVDLD